jgi:predicted alpha-1,2-mannosidase
MWLLIALACAPEQPDPTTEPIAPYDPLPLVDPFIATGGVAAAVTSVTPAASAPLGMVLVGPDTRLASGALSFYHCAGYHHGDTHIVGFSHTHAHGMGVTDYGGMQLMPRARWDDAWTSDAGRMAPFDHAEESASPGYYSVVLQDDQTEVEIAATAHGAHHRYRFAAGAEPVVLLDLGHTLGDDSIFEAWATVDLTAGELVAYQLLDGSYSGRYGGVKHHLVAQFDPAPVASGGWDDPEAPTAGATEASGTASGAWLAWPAGTEQVEVRVGLSFVDHDGARANLEAELPDVDLEARRATTEAAWRELLGRVRVTTWSEQDAIRFHTALYHALLMPSLNSDVDGRYRGLDGEVHSADFAYYSDLSLWDTFRTLHPLYTLAWPEIELDMLRTLARMVEDGGSLPRWPLAHGYTGGMVGSPAIQVLAGSYLKGLDSGWDVDTAFAGAVAAASEVTPDASRAAVESYVALGWVPSDEAGAAASRTLEYAWNDHALARWADAIGAESAQWWQQADSWRNTWDPTQGFFVARDSSGSFAALESEFAWDGGYTEGNAWHYRFGVPQDVDGMIELQAGGDREAWLADLRAYWFDGVMVEPDDILPDDWYWHGNEPVLHYAFLGSLAGDRDLTAAASRWVLRHRYGHDPETGLDGNDDSGTLSAWYLFAALGLYPVAGTDIYAVGSPIVDRAEIERDEGTLVIRAPCNAPHNVAPRGVAANGAEVEGTLLHAQLAGDAELVFSYGAEAAPGG